MTTLENFFLGPFYDLKRFAIGAVTQPPPTRVVSEEGLVAARAVLTAVGCDLTHCTESNLHTGSTTLPPEQLFDLIAAWKLWPCSAFFACPRIDKQGTEWFSYRWYKTIPIVLMKLKTSARPHHIIYDLEWGVGAGGYHSFLFNHTAEVLTEFAIFTTFSPTRLFFEGIHDQVNYDIYRNLQTIQNTTR